MIQEAKALERQIMAADALERKTSESSDLMLLDITQDQQSSPVIENQMSPMLKRRADELKVEGPLTPPMCLTSPMKKLKSVSFANILHEYIPGFPCEDEFSNNFDEEDIDFHAFFRDIEPLAKQAKMNAENERLSGADTTARVDVPHMDFSLPIAPWDEYSKRRDGMNPPGIPEIDAQMKFLVRIKREDLKAASSWHGLSALEKELRWAIFTSKVTNISLDEELHGETEVNKMLAEFKAGSIVTSSSQVWKQEGLRILDEDEDMEDLEREDDEEQRDIVALAGQPISAVKGAVALGYGKRTILQYPTAGHSQSSRDISGSQLPNRVHVRPESPFKIFDQPGQRSQERLSRRGTLQNSTNNGNELMFGGFSTATALQRFMETRGRPVEPVSAKAEKGSLSNPPTDLVSRTLQNRAKNTSSIPSAVADSCVTTQQQADNYSGRGMPTLLPDFPAIPENLAPCSFIVSSTLLKQRALMKQIEQLHPGAEMIYRDYNLRHSSDKEADIILSPSSGLVFTTMQHVKQKALPGQPDRSLIRERMDTLQSRYERLVVLVSEGLGRGMEQLGSSRPDDPRDKEILLQLEVFAAELEGEVLVEHVRGGERALAYFTVVEMAKYGLPHGSADIGDIRPLAAETSVRVITPKLDFTTNLIDSRDSGRFSSVELV